MNLSENQDLTQDITITETAPPSDKIKKFYKALGNLQNSAISYIMKNNCDGNAHTAATLSSLEKVTRIMEEAADDIEVEGGCPPGQIYNPTTKTCEPA